MATNNQKTDLLFKQFTGVVNASQLDPFSNSNSNKFPFQPYILGQDVLIENIPNDLSNISYPDPDNVGEFVYGIHSLDLSFQSLNYPMGISYEIPDTPLIYYYKIELSQALQTTPRSFYIDDGTNSNSSLLKDSIPFLYDPIYKSYFQRVYTNDGTGRINMYSGDLLWLFDYKSGFLQFYGSSTSAIQSWLSTYGDPRISVIVYNGRKGLENFSGGGGITTSGDLNDTSMILGILQQYFPITTDIDGNTLIQQIDNFNITGNLSVSDDANIDGNLVVNGFFGGNYSAPMGSIRTIQFSSIPGINENYYYLGEFTSHLPSYIYILGEGDSTYAGSIFTIIRYHSQAPHISGLLGESYYYYRFFYQAVNTTDTYYLWFRPFLNSGGKSINVTVKIQSFSYNYLSEPSNPSYTECKYGLIQQNEASTTYLGVGTPNPDSSTSTAVSDDRLKFNETTITNGLSVINKLNPVIYDMSPEFNNEVRTRKRSGFVAQEVYEIDDLKHTINVGNDSNPWSIHYNDIFTYNIAATKELNIIVQNQDKEITSLKEKNLELENKLELLKNKLNELLSEFGKEIITF